MPRRSWIPRRRPADTGRSGGGSRAAAAAVGALALALAACGGGSADDAPSASPRGVQTVTETETVASSPSDAAAASPRASASDGDQGAYQTASAERALRPTDPVGPDLDDQCPIDTSQAPVEEVRIAFPSSWRVADGCEFFDPDVESVEPGTEASNVDIGWRVSPVAFERALSPGEGQEESGRRVGVVGGLPALRVTGATTGEALGPSGQPAVTWFVDLAPTDPDEQATLIGSVRSGRTDDFEQAVAVLDRMADTVVINGVGFERPSTPVLFWNSASDAPTAVTAEDDCLRLYRDRPGGERLDEFCGDVALDGREAIGATVLGDGDQRVAVGIVSSGVDHVALRPDDDRERVDGAEPIDLEGGAGFGLPYRPGDTLVALSDGEEVATLEIDAAS